MRKDRALSGTLWDAGWPARNPGNHGRPHQSDVWWTHVHWTPSSLAGSCHVVPSVLFWGESKPEICDSLDSGGWERGECRGKRSERLFESTSYISLPHLSNLGKLAQINGNCFALKCLIAGMKDNFSLVKSYWYEGQPMQMWVMDLCDSLESRWLQGFPSPGGTTLCMRHALKTSEPLAGCPPKGSSFQS